MKSRLLTMSFLVATLAACQVGVSGSVPGTLSRTETLIGANGQAGAGATGNGVPALVVPAAVNGKPVVPQNATPAPSSTATPVTGFSAPPPAPTSSSASTGSSAGSGGGGSGGSSGAGGSTETPTPAPTATASVSVGGFQNLHGQVFTLAGTGTPLTAAAGSGPLADPGNIAYNQFGTSSPINKTFGLMVDGAGEVTFCDSEAGLIRQMSPNTNVSTVVGGLASLKQDSVDASPAPITICGFGVGPNPLDNTWKATGGYYDMSACSNSPGVDGTGILTRLGYPLAIARDSKGDMYFGDGGFGTIRKITVSASGNWVVSTIATGVSSPNGIVCDNTSYPPTIYVADGGKNCIFKIPAGAPVPMALTTPYVGHFVSGNADGTGTEAYFNHPHGLALSANGTLYVTDAGNNSVRRIDVNLKVTTFAGSGVRGWADGAGVNARFWQPTGLTIDAKGNLFLTDTYNQVIRMVDPAGVVTTVAGVPGSVGYADGAVTTAKFNNPYALSVDGFGNLFVADTYNFRLRQVVR